MAQDIHDQINDYQRQLDKGLELQEIMKNSNAIIKKFEANKIDREQAKSQLVEVGLSLSQVDKILEPDFMGRKGFGSYKLTNNNANNKRIKDRIEVLKKKLQGAKEVQKSGQAEEYVFDGGTIEVNYEIDRVQILFPGGRVDKDLFKKLRSNGYVYSPTNKAFQRKITPQAIRNAIYLFDAKKVTASELEKGIEVESEHKDTLEKVASGEISVEQAPEEIAKDHLTEDTKYYDKLEIVESKKEEPKKINTNFVKTKQNVFNIAKDTIGEIMSRPNMFTTSVFFGSDKNGTAIQKTIDNNYLEKLQEIPVLVTSGKSTSYVISAKDEPKKSEPFFREVGSDGYDSDIHKSKKENGEYVLKDAEKEALKYRDFKDDLHELDLWVEHEFPKGEQRHYRKFTFTPEQVKSGVMREITDYGVKETGYSELPNGNISVIISVANGSIANSLSNLWMKLNPIELMTETHFEPNTPEEFDEAIFEHLDEMKSAEWIGHLMKQRIILREINSELHGPENEKEAEVKRLFKAFYEREKANPEYEGTTELKYDPSNPWITDETSEHKTRIMTASIKREANFYQKITSAIIPKIEPHWIGKETSEVALRNQIWNEIQKDTTSNVSSNEDKVKAMNEIYDQVFNSEREKEYGYDKELAEQYATILNMNPEEFNQKFGIKKFFINDYLRASFTFKDNSNSVIDLTLNCVQMELYANITANAWERTSDIAFFLRNAVQYLDDQPDLILANLKTSNKEWTSHPKKYSKKSIEKEQPTMETKEQVAIGYSSNSGTSEGGIHYMYSLEPDNYTFYLNEPVEIITSWSDDWTTKLKDKKYLGERSWNIIFPTGTRVQVSKNKDDWNSRTYMYNPSVIDQWVNVMPMESTLEKIKKSIENPIKKDEPMIETRTKLITSYLPSDQQASDDADDFLKKHVIVAKMPKQDVPKGTQEHLTKHYDNQYQLNKGIEEFMTNKGANPSTYSAEEKAFIKKYSGYGGLSKFGLGGKGAFFEYYTPTPVIRKMWALAYKYGYKGGPILESSVGTGEFLQLAPIEASITAYEINPFSADICRILYPQAKVFTQPFEQNFIENNFTMKDRVTPKYDLCIGNPPYGSFEVVKSRYLSDGMGEFKHVGPKNYAEYFLRRSMDLLKPGGLLILIIGADVINGGTLFLDSGPSDVKDYLAEHSTLLDAYRLPDSVFERTQVTTEIIVLQKK